MKFPIHEFKWRGIPDLDPVFWEVEDPPEKIFIQGSAQALTSLKQLPTHGLAVVGTRTPQARSIGMVKRMLSDLNGAQLIIVSGFAHGIDSVAHETALTAGLPTIAILGGGFNELYPQNFNLRDRILHAGGLFISEFSPDAKPKPHFFQQRNRLIAAWSKATWVVEAAYRSGALNTARWARDHHRNVYVTPGYPEDPNLLGNQGLLDQHHGIAFWGIHSLAQDWIELANWKKRKRKGAFENPTADAQQLAQEVARLTAAQGGAQVQELLDWAIHRSWEPHRFFLGLQEAVRKQAIQESQGLMITI